MAGLDSKHIALNLTVRPKILHVKSSVKNKTWMYLFVQFLTTRFAPDYSRLFLCAHVRSACSSRGGSRASIHHTGSICMERARMHRRPKDSNSRALLCSFCPAMQAATSKVRWDCFLNGLSQAPV